MRRVSSPSTENETPTYHRRPMWCILAGDTEGGGLDMVKPLAGLMMGIALRVLVAAGWCSLRLDCWCWNVGGTNAGDVEFSVK